MRIVNLHVRILIIFFEMVIHLPGRLNEWVTFFCIFIKKKSVRKVSAYLFKQPETMKSTPFLCFSCINWEGSRIFILSIIFYFFCLFQKFRYIQTVLHYTLVIWFFFVLLFGFILKDNNKLKMSFRPVWLYCHEL